MTQCLSFFHASFWHPLMGGIGEEGTVGAVGPSMPPHPPDVAHVGTVVCLCGNVRGMTSLNKSRKPRWVCADGATATENDILMIMKIMVTAVNVHSRQEPARGSSSQGQLMKG